MLRVRGRHLWNPSNFGLCALLLLAPATVAVLSIQWGNQMWPLIEIWLLGGVSIGVISALIRKVAADRTVLMVEHNLSVVADLSDIITVLTRGRILAEGDYDSVSQNPDVMEAYLGTGHA